jgi:hypothetical protein
MTEPQSLDTQVKERLKRWPQRPPGLHMPRRGRHVWLRGRPGDDTKTCHPFLKLPGSTRLRTLPDGLWLNFGGTVADPFVDIFGIMHQHIPQPSRRNRLIRLLYMAWPIPSFNPSAASAAASAPT